MTAPLKTRNTKTSAGIVATLTTALENHKAGKLAVAEVLYRQVLAESPKNFDALHMLAVIAYQTKQHAAALELFEKALFQNSKHLALLVNYGAALREAVRLDEALELYKRALKIDPNCYEALHNNALCLFAQRNLDGAEENYRRCLAIKHNDPSVFTGLANTLKSKDDWRAALYYYELAIQHDPSHAPAYVGMGEVFVHRRFMNTALLMYERALVLDPRNEIARSFHAKVMLSNGHFDKGWRSYEGRFKYADAFVRRRAVPPMYWDGEPLDNKTIKVWTEQGLGDEIIYASMIPDLVERAKGGRVILECERRLIPVFARSFPEVLVRALYKSSFAEDAKDNVDFQIAIASLGLYFRPNFTSFPKHTGYLKADPAQVSAIKVRYGPGPLIGISWRSNGSVALKKSTDLTDWAVLLKQAGATFVNLQYGDCQEDLARARTELGVEIINDPLIDPLKDMDAFFAQVAAMDLVISSSNTTVHVAGALGTPVWLVLQRAGGVLWYWFHKRLDNPIYPSLRLFRQTQDVSGAQHWSQEPLQQAAEALPDWIAAQARRLK